MKIAAKLIRWYNRHHRDLPWRRTRDPWAILVSELMLQQTRVAAVLPYYERFLSRFPRPEDLAEAPESELLAMWAGLGYYSRARNLQRAARSIVGEGGFPRTYAAIRELPGVGPYTAAAVASLAFDLPHAVVDGNVLRVAARLANDASDIGATATKTRFERLAGGWLDRKRPGRFNQALMELGATICVPRNPQCPACPVAADCEARKALSQNQLPVKLRRGTPRKSEITVLVIERRGRLLLWQRPVDSSRMAGFWELPSVQQIPTARLGQPLGIFRHTITVHQYRIMVRKASIENPVGGFRWLSKKELGQLPLSTITRKALSL